MDDPCDPWGAPKSSGARKILRNAYQSWLPPLLLLAALLWLVDALFVASSRPPVGTYIAILALVAAIVAIWPPESNGTKATWLLIFFSLAFLEIRTLYQDRTENQRSQAEIHKREKEEFQNIAKGIDSTLSVAQDGFSSTLNRLEENNKDVTGGRDFVVIEPTPGTTSDGGVSMRAIVMNCDKGPRKCTLGAHVVRSVHAEYLEGRPPYLPDRATLDSMIAGTRPSYIIGDVPPNLMQAFGMVIHPVAEKGAFYTFNIFALNKFVSEALELRFSSQSNRWERSIRVTERNTVIFDDGFK